jgi:SAM-dependent methyltransferase
MNERGIWTTPEEIATHQFDKRLTDAIINLFEINTAVDIGCGNGSYTKYLIEHGIKCRGFDGSPLTMPPCEILDFSRIQNIGKYDLVLCLEVGEHIPVIYQDTFIDNVCNAAYKNIILSWAVEGQGGDGHVNCHDNYYVIGEFQRRGFLLDAYVTNLLRLEASISWFKQTVMAFVWNR